MFNILDLEDFKRSKYYNHRLYVTYEGSKRLNLIIPKVYLKHNSEEYEFGPFDIALMSVPQVLNSIHHPHISTSGRICLGQASIPYETETENIFFNRGGYILKIALMIEGVLSTYYREQAFRPISLHLQNDILCDICSRRYRNDLVIHRDNLNMCNKCQKYCFCSASHQYTYPSNLTKCKLCRLIHRIDLPCKCLKKG